MIDGPFLHVIWLKGPIKDWSSLEAWARKLISFNAFKLLLWVDHYCYNSIEKSWLIEKPPDTIFTNVGLKPREYVNPFRKPGIFIPIILIEDLYPIFYDGQPEDFLMTMMATLIKAIKTEILNPDGLVQVASDILRILILLFFGGCYKDFDILPSEIPFIKPNDPVFSSQDCNIFCRWIVKDDGRKYPENDIIFFNRKCANACKVITDIIIDMSEFYNKNSNARINILADNPDEAFNKARLVVEKHNRVLRDSKLLDKLKILRDLKRQVFDQSKENIYNYFEKNYGNDSENYFSELHKSVSDATFGSFVEKIHAANPLGRSLWENNFKQYFALEDDSKVIYSWLAPGYSLYRRYKGTTAKISKSYLNYSLRQQNLEQCEICGVDFSLSYKKRYCYCCKRFVCSNCSKACAVRQPNYDHNIQEQKYICKKCAHGSGSIYIEAILKIIRSDKITFDNKQQRILKFLTQIFNNINLRKYLSPPIANRDSKPILELLKIFFSDIMIKAITKFGSNYPENYHFETYKRISQIVIANINNSYSIENLKTCIIRYLKDIYFGNWNDDSLKVFFLMEILLRVSVILSDIKNILKSNDKRQDFCITLVEMIFRRAQDYQKTEFQIFKDDGKEILNL